MKKYIKPITELFRTDLENFVCASPTGGREGQWGAGESGDPYANPGWDNEGGNTGGTDPIGEDWGDLNSTAKEWGDFWDWD